MPPASKTDATTVVTDANVLINLAITRRLAWLGRLPGLRFVVPEEVRAEVSRPEHRRPLAAAITAGHITVLRVESPAEIARAAEHATRMGRGESMCLALAELRGFSLASDERRVFRREAVRRIGEARMVTTVDIYVRAIRSGIVSVEDADGDKAALAKHRFAMPFRSFADPTRR